MTFQVKHIIVITSMKYLMQILEGAEGRVARYNEHDVARMHKDWIFGSFVTLPDGKPLTQAFEVKRGVVKAGTFREQWSTDPAGECFEILLSGRARKYFKLNGKEEVIETGPGDVITWNNTVPHRWEALEDTEYIFVRTLR